METLFGLLLAVGLVAAAVANWVYYHRGAEFMFSDVPDDSVFKPSDEPTNESLRIIISGFLLMMSMLILGGFFGVFG
jgi:hypothetical protein